MEGNKGKVVIYWLKIPKFDPKRRIKSSTMGGFHRAGTGKNKKVIEISPLLVFWSERAKE